MKAFYLLVLLLILSPVLFSQLQIKGSVVDKEAKQPLEFAIVQLSNPKKSTTSASDGQFYFSFPTTFQPDSSIELTVSYFGYQTKKILLVSIKEPILIELERGSVNLAEVVIRPQTNESSFHTISKSI